MDAKAIIERMKKAHNVSKYPELGEILGVKVSAIDGWIRRNTIPEKHILKSVFLTGKPKEWFLYGDKNKDSLENKDSKTIQMNTSINIPLLSAGAGAGVYNYEEQTTLLTINTDIFKDLKNKKLMAIEIIGDSMEPRLKDGDYIIVTPIPIDRNTEDGIYAIRIDGKIKVKALQFKLDGSIKIFSLNPAYEPEIYNPQESQIDFQIIGKKALIISK